MTGFHFRRIVLLLLVTVPFAAFCQKSENGDSLKTGAPPSFFCGTDAILQKQRKDPHFTASERTGNRQIALSPLPTLDEVLQLPLVIHVIGNDPDSLTDAMITAGIKDLNDAFSRQGNYSSSQGADTKIRFCLAKTDPDGGITTGINRITHFYGQDHNFSIEQKRLKSLIQWDPGRYINIWFIKNTEDEVGATFNCGLPGRQWSRFRAALYGTMPTGSKDSVDGIVTPVFGPRFVHEMGHYLGLYHTYEGGCRNNDCAVDGDKVCDTPPDNSVLSTCNLVQNSCSTDSAGINPGFLTDQNDRTNNFMDNSACPNEFTKGQADRMHKIITTLRSGLLVNKCNPPCGENITALFSRDSTYPVPGTTATFTNASTGGSNYQWLVNDVQAASTTNFSYTFNNIGKTKITLKAFNGSSCFASYSQFITVTCGVAARFWADKRTIASKKGLFTDSILFTNTSVNASECKWLLSNDNGLTYQIISTTIGNLNYTFSTPGIYYLRLAAFNGSCTDTTDRYEIVVKDPTPDAITVINSSDCFQDSAVRVGFSICNKGYMPLKAGAPVSFYDGDPLKAGTKKLEPTFYVPNDLGGGSNSYCCWGFTHILNVGNRQLNQVYIVYGDSGNIVPVKLPNTGIVETNYNNNISSFTGFNYSVSVKPTVAVLAPEDTLLLTASVYPANLPATYRWLPAYNLSCSTCQSTSLYADSTSTKQVIATSFYGCTDTAVVNITVPPAYDFSIKLNDVQCAAADDSLFIDFSLFNQFKRDFMPEGLKVAFYKGNPSGANAVLLPPVFSVPQTLRSKPFNYTTFIKGMSEGNLYAVVNDNGSSIPVKLPNDTTFKEVNYNNNATSFNYKRITVAASNAGPFCERDTIRLNASSIPGASFTWIGPAAFSSNEQLPLKADSKAINNGYYVATAAKYGCSSIADSTLVTIYEAPVLNAGYQRPVCETKTLQLIATSTNGNAYTWTGPNFTSNLQNPSINDISFGNSGQYTLMSTSNKGCTSLPFTINVVVNPLPVTAFSDTITCLPSTTAFFYNKTIIQSGSIASYSWNFGDAASGTANTSANANPIHSYTRAGSYMVTLTATSDSGCSVAVSNSYNRFKAKPKADFLYIPNSNLCANDVIDLTDNSNGADGNLLKWKWLYGDGMLTENSDASPVSHRYGNAGNYTISLEIVNNFGCGDTINKTVTVYALPLVDAGPRQYVLLGNSTSLQPVASGNGLTYLWTPATYLSETTIPNPVVVRAQDDMQYTLTVTTANHCIASDTTFIKILKPLVIPNAFSPNGDGINDVWNVRYLADYPGATMDIFDRYGRIVHHSTNYNQPWDGRSNGNPVPVGVYYYIITPKNGAATVNGSVTVVR